MALKADLYLEALYLCGYEKLEGQDDYIFELNEYSRFIQEWGFKSQSERDLHFYRLAIAAKDKNDIKLSKLFV